MTSIAVVGATDQVGRVMRAILEERNFPADKVRFSLLRAVRARSWSSVARRSWWRM